MRLRIGIENPRDTVPILLIVRLGLVLGLVLGLGLTEARCGQRAFMDKAIRTAFQPTLSIEFRTDV